VLELAAQVFIFYHAPFLLDIKQENSTINMHRISPMMLVVRIKKGPEHRIDEQGLFQE
jgi:hypothetical protein